MPQSSSARLAGRRAANRAASDGVAAARSWLPPRKRASPTLRRTCATEILRRGLNANQAQVWLRHRSPAFTLATYVHLLSDDLPESPFELEGGFRPDPRCGYRPRRKLEARSV